MHDTEDPTRSSAADAAGMAADYSARATYARGYEDGRRAAKADTDDAESYFARAMEKWKAEKARADAAERMVAELRGIVADVATWDPLMPGEARVLEDARAALTRTEAVAGRWCPVAERDAAIAARDEAVALLDAERKHSAEELDEVRAERDAAIADRNRACDAREAAERARDEVGIQYAAAQVEIARLKTVVDAFDRFGRNATDENMIALGRARRALDTVPGDELAPVGTINGVPVYVDSTLPDGYVRRDLSPDAVVSVHPCGATRPTGAVGIAETAGGDRFHIDASGNRIDEALRKVGG